jgi:Tol biopolymer transport system component
MLRLVFIVVVCCFLLGLAQSSAHSSSLTAGDTIVFASRAAGGDAELVVVNRDGSQRQQLTTNRVEDVLPAWSPDHSRIAFARKASLGKASIWVMSASGARQHRLRLGTHPSWSPNGSQLAFDRGGVIYTMSDHGRNVRRITRGNHPVWAPRGRTIAFERGTKLFVKLFVVNIDTRAVRLLADRVSGLACERYGEGDPAVATLSSPEWSPDATRLLVSLSCDYYKSAYVKAMTVGLDSKGVTGDLPINALVPGSRMAWSPDGSRLAFATGFPGPGQYYYPQLATAKTDGTEMTTLTSDVGSDRDPDW